MQIYGPSQLHGPQRLQGPHWNRATTPASGAQAADEVNISPAAEAAIGGADGGDSRADLVARVRSEIASGTYETPDKMAIAIDSLFNEIG
jgi:negative regulator of flagellin synthesis FlgM